MDRSFLRAVANDERQRRIEAARGKVGLISNIRRIPRRREGREKREAEPSLYPSTEMINDIPLINVEQLFYDLSRRKAQAKNLVRCENMATLEMDYFKSPSRRRISSGSCSSSIGSSTHGRQIDTLSQYDTGSLTVESKMCSSYYNQSQPSRGSSVSSSSNGLRQHLVGSYSQRSSFTCKPTNSEPVCEEPLQQESQYAKMEKWCDSKMGNTSEKSDYSYSYDDKEKSYNAPLKSDKGYYETAAPSDPLEVEVFPGVFMMLRGSEETWQAVQANHICNAFCICCGSSLYCIRDADFVLCPDCRAISPVYNGSEDKLKDAKRVGGGVGLGFTPQDLVNWQSEPFFAC